MNRNYKFSAILFAVLFSIGASSIVRAQDNNTNYAFVVFETSVTKKGVETSDKNPQEQRIYISNIVEFPNNTMNDRSVFRNAFKVADEYFIANVVKPMEQKGILHQYYDDAITINNKESYLDTRELVEDTRKRVLENFKERNANVFTFSWTRDADAKGLETSQPTLLYRGSEQPLYGAIEPKTPPTKTNVKPSTKKKTD
jgi:pimeloyl-CoA synthetase